MKKVYAKSNIENEFSPFLYDSFSVEIHITYNQLRH